MPPVQSESPVNTNIAHGFFDQDVVEVARKLIGAGFLFDGVGGTIIETEAYRADDSASHSFRGPTPRNRAMFGPSGCAYVYRSHGLHWCFNMTCGAGSGVLIRALEPLQGIAQMQTRRGTLNIRLLCAGPGRLCQALGIDGSIYGLLLAVPPFELTLNPSTKTLVGTRIGISRSTDLLWRFGLAHSGFLSRPFK